MFSITTFKFVWMDWVLLKVFEADTQLEHTFCLNCILLILWLFVVSWYFSPLFSGAVYLEGGLEEARQLFGRLLFNGEVPNKLCPAALFFWFLPFASL